MSDDVPPDLPFKLASGRSVMLDAHIVLLLEVIARHDRDVADEFAERFAREGNEVDTDMNEIAHALGTTSSSALIAEWRAEQSRRFRRSLT